MTKTAPFLLCIWFLGLWAPLSAQKTTGLYEDEAWLTNFYHHQVTHVSIRWPLADGDTLYFGAGNHITEEDSLGKKMPLVCLRHENALSWIHYIDLEVDKIHAVLGAKTINDQLVMAIELDRERVFLFEIDKDGNFPSLFAMQESDVAGWGQDRGKLIRAYKEASVWQYPGWHVFKRKQNLTALSTSGNLVWNAKFSNLEYSHDLVHYAPDGSLHMVANTLNGKSNLTWYQFRPDGTIIKGLYAPSREEWSTKAFTSRKKYQGLYDRVEYVDRHTFHAVNGGEDGFLVIQYTKFYAKLYRNSYEGHTLVRTDKDGNLLWTRRYTWNPKIISEIKDTEYGFKITNYDKITYQLGADGFYIEQGESIRKTLKIKDKKLAKYDALDQADLVLETVKADFPTPIEKLTPQVFVVDTPAYTYPTEESYSGSSTGRRIYSRTRPKLFRKGPLYKAAGKAIKGAGKLLRRIGRGFRK